MRSEPPPSGVRHVACSSSDHHDIIYTYPDGVEGWLISIKFVAGFRDVKEQIYGSKGMVETARTYYKLHGPIEASRLRDADRLEDKSLIERVELSWSANLRGSWNSTKRPWVIRLNQREVPPATAPISFPRDKRLRRSRRSYRVFQLSKSMVPDPRVS